MNIKEACFLPNIQATIWRVWFMMALITSISLCSIMVMNSFFILRDNNFWSISIKQYKGFTSFGHLAWCDLTREPLTPWAPTLPVKPGAPWYTIRAIWVQIQRKLALTDWQTVIKSFWCLPVDLADPEGRQVHSHPGGKINIIKAWVICTHYSFKVYKLEYNEMRR